MAYSHTTLGEAEDFLASLLADLSGAISKVRWVSAELQSLIIRSLRTWSALTGIHEVASEPFTVAANSIFVDLPTAVPSLRGYAVVDRDVIGAIQYHFGEPYDPIDGTGMTEMLSFDEIVRAVERRRDQFLGETTCRVTRSVLPESPDLIEAGQQTLGMADTTISLVRAAWVAVSGRVTPLRRSSEWATRASEPRINQISETPRSFLIAERAPMVVELNPVPANPGRLDLLTIESGAELDPASGSGTLLGIPDDYSWAIEFGAMADLLSKDGPMRDYARALFCERRYRLGVAAAMSRGIVLDARINGQQAQFSLLHKLDSGRPDWQSRTATRPTVVAPSGLNLLALADPPSADVQMELTLRRNAPAPSSASDFLQVGREHLQLVLGYAAHLASFKLGGQEFAATTRYADSFFEAAAAYNDDEAIRAAWEDVSPSGDDPPESRKVSGVQRQTGQTVR